MALEKYCKNCFSYEKEYEDFTNICYWDDDKGKTCGELKLNYCRHLKRRVSPYGCCNGYLENSSLRDADSYRS